MANNTPTIDQQKNNFMSLPNNIICETIRQLILGAEELASIADIIQENEIDEIIETLGLFVDHKFSNKQIGNYTLLENGQDHSKWNEFYDKIISQYDKNEFNNLIALKLVFRKVTIDLNFRETFIVLNSLAIKWAALRGGLWSTAGKQVEKPLMLTLCKLHHVPPKCYPNKKLKSLREVDFYLTDLSGKNYRCEVKLMGKGNPESADAIHARDTQVFIADKLSDTNIKQLDEAQVEWVELRQDNGYQRFCTVLQNLNIPYEPFHGDINARLDEIFTELELM